MLKKNLNIIFISIAIFIHVLFYISAIKFHFFDFFFPWGNVHEFQGIDFFQVPNGAYMFLRGGSLTGESLPNLPTYSFGNYNVYHPFFTVVFGSFFTLFSPTTAFLAMIAIKIIITIFILLFLYKKFRKNKYFPLAIFIFLSFFPQYLELWNGQYHFFLMVALFFLLYLIINKRENDWLQGLLFFSSLIVKPIGLLWIPVFFIKKQLKNLFLGLSLFTLATIPFLLNKSGLYFINNLLERMTHPIGGPPGVFTIDAVARFYSLPFYDGSIVKSFLIFSILFLIIRSKISAFWGLFLMTSFYLLFYDLVFEFHYTILIPFFVLGILTQKIIQNKTAIALILSFSLPTPFFVFHFFQIFARGHFVTDRGWVLIVLFRTLPLIIFSLLVLIKLTKGHSGAFHKN